MPLDLFKLDIQNEQLSTFFQFETLAQVQQYGYTLIQSAAVNEEGKLCCWTALDDSKVIGCGGIVKVSPTIGEAWLLLGKDIKKYTKKIIPKLRREINQVDILRIQAMADTKFIEANRFLKMLGFNYEATLEKSGLQGADQNVYKIIRS